MSAHLVIKMANTGGNDFPVDVDLTATVAELKEQIAGQAGLPKEHIRLVCGGRIWQDVATVGSYSPAEGAIVHCLNNPPRTTPVAAQQTLTAVNPMQALLGGGAPPAPQRQAGAGDPFAQMMAQSQQMMAQNPEMMRQLMDSPLVQQVMSNPEMMRSMMRMNPQLNQLMEQRPEIARLLEDPEVLQQSMQMVQNPSLMREMQRNADRAIGQLDAMPGGHEALVRAHEEMVDPLMAALSGSGNQGTGSPDLAAYTQPTDGGPNNEALPNPWGTPAPAHAATPAVAPPMVPAAAPPPNPMVAPPTMPAAGQQPNPMLAMMQMMNSMPSSQQQPAAQPGAMQPGAMDGSNNALVAMMQQMLSNPARPQPPMQMPAATPPPATTPAPGNAETFAAPAQLPLGAPAPGGTNPMMNMLFANPTMMQQSMLAAQQMFGAGGLPGAGLAAPMVAPAAEGPPNPAMQAMTDASARARFATQLAQLSAMGFFDEAACLRALQQHQGRVDAAIDALLANGDNSS